MLSKVSVDEVFIHHFDKMSSASGGASPQTPTGVLPVDPAGGLPSFRSPHCLPLEKIFRVPMTERNVMHATSWHRGNDHVLRTELQIFTCIFNRSHFEQRSKWHSMTCVWIFMATMKTVRELQWQVKQAMQSRPSVDQSSPNILGIYRRPFVA